MTVKAMLVALMEVEHSQTLYTRYLLQVQWSLYFKTTHGTKKMWYYIAAGLK